MWSRTAPSPTSSSEGYPIRRWRPCTAAPTIRVATEGGRPGIRRGWRRREADRASVQRRLPALEDRRAPVLPEGSRALDPGTQLGLGELAVRLLQPDAVRVARLE